MIQDLKKSNQNIKEKLNLNPPEMVLSLADFNYFKQEIFNRAGLSFSGMSEYDEYKKHIQTLDAKDIQNIDTNWKYINFSIYKKGKIFNV